MHLQLKFESERRRLHIRQIYTNYPRDLYKFAETAFTFARFNIETFVF